jgi:hypothetical protein
MTRDRMNILISSLRFDDASTRESRKKENRLAAISEVTERFRAACISNFISDVNVTVDERVVPFTGNCRFRTYMPNKPDKHGINLWVLSCSQIFYVKNFDVYLGKVKPRETNQGECVDL